MPAPSRLTPGIDGLSRGRFRASLFCGLTALLWTLVSSSQAPAQAPADKPENSAAAEGGAIQDFHSPHFLIHTDMSAKESEELLKRFESMIKLISGYWGRPASGVLECWVVKDFSVWPKKALTEFPDEALARVKKDSGICVSVTLARGNQFVNKARVFTSVSGGVDLHEAVHGYCCQTFGRTGPRWYADGMAEIGRYWIEGERGVNAFPFVIKYLREEKPKKAESLIVIDPHEVEDWHDRIDGSWKEYAWWWSVAHFLENNPNYSARFRAMGLELLAGKKPSFKEVFGDQSKELEFEYRFFLDHLEKGFREDLCGWDWKKKFLPIRSRETTATAVTQAGHGWQPSGATLKSGVAYEYKTTGKWQAAKKSPSISADGNKEGLGRLEGVMFKEYELGEPFDLGASGEFKPPSDGDLYLRCKSPWSKLPEGSGKITVRVKLKS